MAIIQAIRGTKDILPQEIPYWQQVETIASQILARAMYQEIRCPIFEQTSLFERGIGEATDVVGKEMYTFCDRKDRSITLRPEGTAGVVRAYIEHSLYSLGGVQRLWYKGAMFRYERPQEGRQRQFHQIGVELIGTDAPRSDVEVIALAVDILQALGLKSLRLDLNSVGNKEDRSNYREALVNYFTPYKLDLDPDSQDRLTRNPLRILDSKDAKTKEIAKNAPSIINYLGVNSRKHFEQVQQLLTDLKIEHKINPCLVRGLDYYTHTAFEIQSDDLGSQSTVCGGGRYDGLVRELGGTETPAFGCAFGMERLILLLQQQGKAQKTKPDFYFVSKGEKAEAQALILAQKLRNLGFTVELDLSGSAFGKQFKRADRSEAYACLILGEEEALINNINVKWMLSKKQETFSQSKLLEISDQLRQQINESKQN